ncbi:GroES-like protein [Annulohypoxylon truncatum]|uniref:GroES-like protein n=1 Tax=Annulohypoxylon truncatum TaxID=327061 RepID=UPI0020085E40|nr:GroES-like protein [Annulohypoxylon truncatum]KAI1204264.1 GroES-like protein [Annulohypoxylon truncatum]
MGDFGIIRRKKVTVVVTMADTRPRYALTSRNSWKTVRTLLRRIRTKSNLNPNEKSHSAAIQGIRKDSTPTTTDESANVSVAEFTIPEKQKALVVARKGEYEIRHDFPMPIVGDDEIMIRSHYVGLNPIDWKSVDYNFCLPEFPWVTGREMSGVVAQVGSAVKTFKEGDSVWTSTYYKDVRAGCFQEFVVVPSHTVLPIPSNIPFEAAACLGVAALTASMTLWKWLGVPAQRLGADEASGEWLLVWGGSTVTGQFATQIANLSGIKVITVNSTETKSLSERLGANHVVVRDGKTDEQVVDEIRTITAGGITRAIDLVGPKTAALALDAVSKDKPVHFAPLAMMSNSQTVPENVVVHTVEMKQFVLDKSNVRYTEELGKLLEDGKIVLPELHLIEGGLHSVVGGLEMLKKGNLKGKKLVVRM